MADAKKGGWFSRLKEGLTRTSTRISQSISTALGRRKLDQATLDELEEALIGADLGPKVAARLVEELRRRKFGQDVSDADVRLALAQTIADILAPVATPFAVQQQHRPHVVLVVGVNGSGKTTTIGKLAHHLRRDGKRVMMAACDTFRAAAVSQLQIWGERAGCPVIVGPPNGDAAALAFQALEQARRDGIDVLLIDTAGRLHNKADLMAELTKMIRVLKKLDADAPHDCLLVLDATIGQNAIAQVDIFKTMVNVSGLVVTKLDGSARGGILVAIAERFATPVVAIGVGEGIDDLDAFAASDFARGLLGLE